MQFKILRNEFTVIKLEYKKSFFLLAKRLWYQSCYVLLYKALMKVSYKKSDYPTKFTFMKILVAEDEPIILRLTEMCLSRAGFTVIKAMDGMQAFQLIENSKPDLVLTDLMMPVMSGFELIKEIKQHYDNQFPIIVLSSLDDESTIREVKQLGADEYLVKTIYQ